LHHAGGTVVPVRGMKGFLEAEDGRVYREVELREWIGMAVEEGLDVLVAEYLAAVDEMGSGFVFQELIKEAD
jgi:hypothetical protein